MAIQTNNAVSDLSTLLKVPNKTLEEVVDKLNLCIGSIINDAVLAGEQTTIINIGIGNLGINLADMQVKFVPSKDLKQAIKKAAQDKVDPLVLALENSIIEKLTAACREAL